MGMTALIRQLGRFSANGLTTPLSNSFGIIRDKLSSVEAIKNGRVHPITILTALVIAREWERGTMEALMATPATMSEILIGKLIPYFILGMFSMLLCFIVAYFWYEIPFMGSFFILIILSSIYLFSSLSIGLLISTLAKNQFVAAQMSLIVGFLPAFILSGFLFEIGNMPQWLQYITSIIPARYFVESLQTIFLAGNIYEIFIFDAFIMILISALLFAFVLKKSKKAL
jgi:ABC-2 type transport system permease protein